jgi:hypothetical protein
LRSVDGARRVVGARSLLSMSIVLENCPPPLLVWSSAVVVDSKALDGHLSEKLLPPGYKDLKVNQRKDSVKKFRLVVGWSAGIAT